MLVGCKCASTLPIPGTEGEVKWGWSENFENTSQRYSWSTHTHTHNGESLCIVSKFNLLNVDTR